MLSFPIRNQNTPRLIAIVVVLFCGMIVLSAVQLQKYRDDMLAERGKETAGLVENVNSLVLFYYAKISHEGLPEKEAQQYAIEAIRLLNAHGGGYFWIMDQDGKIIMHATQPALEGQNVVGVQDKKGRYLFREMLDIAAQKGAGFVRYDWSKPGASDQESFPKLSYVKSFAPWGWVIGSGLYIDDVDTAFWHAVYMTASLGAALLVFAVALTLMASEGLKKNAPPL